LFVHRSWRHARVLLIGAILTPGRRTVASVLRITGRSRERHFVHYHRVLSRAAWCPRVGARILLGLLLDAFAPSGPVVMALDDTIERRWGRRIRARGIYRDPVRSSDAHFVKTSGLRWISLMLLAPIPWAGRVWALPFLTALVPSERSCAEQGCRHKTLLDVGRQLALQARRWSRAATSCSLATAGLPPWRSLTRGVAPGSQRSRVCASTQRCTSQLHPACPARSDARARRVLGCLPCPSC
jgi:DDE superfamily endonuclease